MGRGARNSRSSSASCGARERRDAATLKVRAGPNVPLPSCSGTSWELRYHVSDVILGGATICTDDYTRHSGFCPVSSRPCLVGRALAEPLNRNDFNFGPYNLSILEGGVEWFALSDGRYPTKCRDAWSSSVGCAIHAGSRVKSSSRPSATSLARLAWDSVERWHPVVRVGSTSLHTSTALENDRWYAVAAVYDGSAAHLYLDGEELDAKPR